jgi:hypothetical protein
MTDVWIYEAMDLRIYGTMELWNMELWSYDLWYGSTRLASYGYIDIGMIAPFPQIRNPVVTKVMKNYIDPR